MCRSESDMGECYPPSVADGTAGNSDRRPRLLPREKPAVVSCEPGDLRAEPTEPLASDEDDYELPRRCPAALRCRQREQRRRLLRLASDKLASVEDLREKDLRQATLLQNMAARLEAEVRAERAARTARPRGARAYARTLGRSFGDASSAERRRRRREECRLLEADVQEMFSDIYNQPAPVLIGPLDEDDEAPAKPARRRDEDDEPPAKRARAGAGAGAGAENADPNVAPPAPQEQVRFADEPPLGCAAAAAGFADFHVFHHLVPSLES